MDQAQPDKPRQEEAYDFVSGTFVKLLENDSRISYEHKRSVIAFWEDLFAHDGVRNNMVQAFSNFLEEIDPKIDAARKAGIVQMEEAITRSIPVNTIPADIWEALVAHVRQTRADLLKSEDAPEEKPIKAEDLEHVDLSEVGGGDEDDTSPL